AASFAGRFDGLQVSNRAVKTNRLLVQVSLTQRGEEPSLAMGPAAQAFALASAEPDAALPRPANPVIAATPTIPPIDIAPAPDTKAAVAVPMPHEKPAEKIEKAAEKIKKAVVAAVAPQHENFDESQISGLRGRLRLSEDQIGYWPAVEEALRDVYRTQL